MRKSSAPSFRRVENANQTVPIRRVDHLSSTAIKYNENSAPNPQSENVTGSTTTDDSKQVYNVVWGKRSTKKHKTFEGDGTLTVSNKNATLRSGDGSYLGSSTIKPEEIEIGARLTIGSNEIEIIERTTGVALPKRKAVEDGDEADRENKKKSKSTFRPYLSVSTSARALPSTKMNFALGKEKDYEALVMPEPTAEHQQKFNASNRSVKEVSIVPCCARELRPHQREGVQFLYECLMGYRSIEHFGCILADEMGLGKTLQCISVCYTLLKQGPYGLSVASRILVSVK